MTDRELLELAAKAAGVFLTPEKFAEECTSTWDPRMTPSFSKSKECMTGYRTWLDEDGDIGGWEQFDWNPLESDGDALRLAVTLELLIDTHGLHARVCYPYEAPLAYESMGQDRAAATRRAIVRAAAEIGRQMP